MITVATALDELGLATAAEGNAEDARRDRILTRLIASATATLGRELARYLGPPEQVTVLKRGGRGIALLVLDDDPATGDAITAPAIRLRSGIGAVWTIPATTDYEITGAALRHAYAWPEGTVEVTYTRGYEPDAGPAELREIVLDMVTGKYVASQSDALALQSESIGDYKYSNFTAADLAAAVGASSFGDMATFVKHFRRQLA